MVRDNVFVGSGNILNAPRPPVSIIASDNWMPAGLPLPPGWGAASGEALKYVGSDAVEKACEFDATSLPNAFPPPATASPGGS